MVLHICFDIFLFMFGMGIGIGILIIEAEKRGYMKRIKRGNVLKWVSDITQEDINYEKENKE